MKTISISPFHKKTNILQNEKNRSKVKKNRKENKTNLVKDICLPAQKCVRAPCLQLPKKINFVAIKSLIQYNLKLSLDTKRSL